MAHEVTMWESEDGEIYDSRKKAELADISFEIKNWVLSNDLIDSCEEHISDNLKANAEEVCNLLLRYLALTNKKYEKVNVR